MGRREGHDGAGRGAKAGFHEFQRNCAARDSHGSAHHVPDLVQHERLPRKHHLPKRTPVQQYSPNTLQVIFYKLFFHDTRCVRACSCQHKKEAVARDKGKLCAEEAVTGPDLDAGRAVRHKRHRIISGGGVDVTEMGARDRVRIIPLLVPPGTHHLALGVPIRTPSHAQVHKTALIVNWNVLNWTVGKQQ